MEELGKSLPVVEGIVHAEEGSNPKQINEFCLNCGTKLNDLFCHHCGQKDIPQRQTLSELWSNFISSFWSYEGKFFKTTKYLITKPGFLAEEYTKGKRESYYHPARMYVFISFVFFLAFFSINTDEESKKDEPVELTEKDKAEIKANAQQGLDKFATITGDSSFRSLGDSIQKQIQVGVDSTSAKKKKKKSANFDFGDVSTYKNAKTYDSLQQTKPESERDNWFERLITLRAIKVYEKYGDDTDRYGEEFIAAFKDQFSKVLFYLLPFFALLLKLLYLRRGYYYSEHLVFSIYYYNFFYLAGTLQILVQVVPWLEWLSYWIVLWIFVYLFFAMKRMYKQGWRKTALKYILLGFTFMILVAIGFSISAFAIFLSI